MSIIHECQNMILAIQVHEILVNSKSTIRILCFVLFYFILFVFIFRLIVKLKEKMGDEWFKQIPKDIDEQRYFNMMKIKDPPTTNLYDWYRLRSNQLYLDACFILCIRGYSCCIELQPNLPLGYLNRAACYLKMFEVSCQKRV